MQVFDLPFEIEVVTADLKRMGEGRAPGLHLGQIIRVMQEEAGRNLGDIEGEQKNVRIYAGFLWEEAMEWAFKRAMGATRPVERQCQGFELDGIHVSPDGICLDCPRMEEYKFTWKSLRHFREQDEFEKLYWHWLVQIKGYLWVLGLTECDLFVFFANGDYSYQPGAGPQVVRRRLSFELGELERNWQNILKVKERMGL